MEAIKLCRLDTPIIFIEARINLSRFVVTGCAAKTSATVTFPSLNLISLFAFCFNIWLRRDAVKPDIEAERKKRDEIEAGKSYCSRRFGGATCDDKSAQIYARFDKNDWRIQPAEFYRFHDAEVNTFGYF